MGVKVWFCALVYIILQFYFLKDVAGSGSVTKDDDSRMASEETHHLQSRSWWTNWWRGKCKNDSDCDSTVKCYANKCKKTTWYHRGYGHRYGRHYYGGHRPSTYGVCKDTLVTVAKCPTPKHIVCQDRVICAIKCNNITECKGGEDELGCPDCENCNRTQAEKCSPSQMYCLDRVTCGTKCDNITDCVTGEDEKGCPDCENCNETQGCDDIFAFKKECKEYKDEFMECPDMSFIVGQIGAVIPGKTSEECKALCLANPACIHYQILGGNNCALISISMRDAIKNLNYVPIPTMIDAFVRICKVC